MDHLVGRVIDEVDRLGVRDNTCIVFTSDNGPWWVGDTAGLYGRKGETYEGGIRVPFVMEWPAMMRRNGRVYDGVTSHIDVLPTFCAAAGVPLRRDRVIDGQSILAAIRTGREIDHVDIAYYQGDMLNALRHADWKLHLRRVVNVLPRFTGRVDWTATAEMPRCSTSAETPRSTTTSPSAIPTSSRNCRHGSTRSTPHSRLTARPAIRPSPKECPGARLPPRPGIT